MRYIIGFIFILSFTISCSQKNINEKEIVEDKGVGAIAEESEILYDGTWRADTTIIANQQFRAVYNEISDRFYIINEKNDTIFNEDLGLNFEFVDFDQDGYDDVLFTYMGNVYVNDLLLYSPEKNNFVKVDSLTKFPDAKRIKGTHLYYSYHRSGCADASWDSDLFYIKDFKTHLIGNISVTCTIDTVFINKVRNGKHILYQKFPLEVLDKYEEYKWGFIEDYWTKNYSKF